jgi:hypothetical protein
MAIKQMHIRARYLREGLTDMGVPEDVDAAAGDASGLAKRCALTMAGRFVRSASGLACCGSASNKSAGSALESQCDSGCRGIADLLSWAPTTWPAACVWCMHAKDCKCAPAESVLWVLPGGAVLAADSTGARA